MASLIGRKGEFDIATGDDADADRHGIVTPDVGLMNRTTSWPWRSATCSAAPDPIGPPILRQRGVGGGVVFAPRRVVVDQRQGRSPAVLLASEIQAATGKSPSEHYAGLVAEHGEPAYARVDAPADRAQKAALATLSPEDVTPTSLAGEEIIGKLTKAPGNHAAIGGLKVTTESAWFAARPSGTEDVYKVYAESFRGPDHMAEVQAEALRVVSEALVSLHVPWHQLVMT